MLDIQEVKEFFMEASINTYAGSAVRKSTIKELPESKVFHYERGNFLYADCYFSKRGKSCGQTMIWYNGTPVWWMQYHGEWSSNDGRIIPFLKEALKGAYKEGKFIGGRGPLLFTNKWLVYINHYDGDFKKFKGIEWIILKENSKLVFWHKYFGSAFF